MTVAVRSVAGPIGDDPDVGLRTLRVQVELDLHRTVEMALRESSRCGPRTGPSAQSSLKRFGAPIRRRRVAASKRAAVSGLIHAAYCCAGNSARNCSVQIRQKSRGVSAPIDATSVVGPVGASGGVSSDGSDSGRAGVDRFVARDIAGLVVVAATIGVAAARVNRRSKGSVAPVWCVCSIIMKAS